MTTTTETCWADPLSRAERRVLREKLSSACHMFFAHGEAAQRLASAEMSDLHLDVTERAEVATS